MMLDLVNRLRSEWATPRSAVYRGKEIPFRLQCDFDVGASDEELSSVPHEIPLSVREFWRASRQAKLFVDAKYGQWGLRIWTPEQARESTNRMAASSEDMKEGDLVIGEFLGDSDRLIVRCATTQPDYGHVVVCWPIDPREVWPTAADSFESFIEKLATVSGDKYWEAKRPEGSRH